VIRGAPEWILDVAHNPQAAEVLAASLAARPCAGRTWAICGILGDKDIEGIVAALRGAIARWIAVGLEGSRALPSGVLAERIRMGGAHHVSAAADIGSGLALAQGAMQPHDRAVVFGSFLTVGPALEYFAARR
jgi:dihydrofolate synthase/folylpolyglutamate synthase